MTEDKPMLECTDPEVGALLMSYGLGTLTDAEAEQFEQHLLHCPACQQEAESAMLSLDALSSTREQFVLRAHQEKEDFESQYDKLARDKRTASAELKIEKSRGWLESFWEAVWGRKWIIGTAGAVVIAMMFVLREGPELTQPSVVKDESVSLYKLLPPNKVGAISDSSGVNIQPEKMAVEDAQEVEVSQIQTLSAEAIKNAVTSKAKAAARQVEKFPGIIAQKEVVTESVADLVAAEEEETIIGQEMVVQYDALSGFSPSEKLVADSNRVDEYGQIAEAVLGKFDADQYPKPYPEEHIAEPVEVHEQPHLATAKGGRQRDNDEVTADTFSTSELTIEARKKTDQRWRTDSTDVQIKIMAGVASLMGGDYVRAKTSLEIAYNLLPQGTQKNDVGLLLARTHILAGQLEEARTQLQNVAGAESDSTRKAFALNAIAKMDSIKNAEALKQPPK